MKLTKRTLKKMINEVIQEVNIGGEDYTYPEDLQSIASRPDDEIVNDAIHTAESALEEWLSMATRDMPEDLVVKYKMIVDRLSTSMRQAALGAGGASSIRRKARSMTERKKRK